MFLLGLLGIGGWYGWRTFGDQVAPPPPRPPVVIPSIPAELEPPMRAMAGDALADMYQEIEGRVLASGVPREPSEEWLAGVYLGNASQFEDVRTFWTGVRTFAERLGDEELGAFHSAYVAVADSADFEADVRARLVERADSGFLATREARMETYGLLADLANASLRLHDFLLTHEADIAYTPAAAFSGNPVEEAVPATEEIGDQMWDRVEAITNALDALGTLDRVTWERLSTVLLDRVQALGIR